MSTTPTGTPRPWLDKLKAHDFLAVTDSDMADMPKLQLMLLTDALQQSVAEKDDQIKTLRMAAGVVLDCLEDVSRDGYGLSMQTRTAMAGLRTALGGKSR